MQKLCAQGRLQRYFFLTLLLPDAPSTLTSASFRPPRALDQAHRLDIRVKSSSESGQMINLRRGLETLVQIF